MSWIGMSSTIWLLCITRQYLFDVIQLFPNNPVSTYLFILCTEVLNQSILFLKGFLGVAQTCKEIFFVYADDAEDDM